MTDDHLPECLIWDVKVCMCICLELRACEARVTALATPETVSQATYWYEQGQSDALAAAVQRVEALIDPWPNTSPGVIRRVNVFAAIKGEQP